MARAEIARWTVICGAAGMLAAAVVPPADTGEDVEPALFDLVGGSEIPHSIIHDMLEIGADVAAFLSRMLPGV